MQTSSLTQELVKAMEDLDRDQQQQVLGYVRSLKAPLVHGVPGDQMKRFAGWISPDGIREISKTIEAGCERVDEDEW